MNLDQLKAFVTSAITGSFSAAGQKLGKTQGAISIAVKNLEIELDLKLFDRSTNYPKLTVEGKALLNDAEQTLNRADFFLSKAVSLSEGIENKVVLTIDDIVLVEDLKSIFESFGDKFPFVELEIIRSLSGDASKMVASGRADIGIMAPIGDHSGKANYRMVTSISFIPVVHADHELAGSTSIKASDFIPFRQIVETINGVKREPQRNIQSRQVWYVESLLVVCDLIRKGLGWGFVPQCLIDKDIDAGIIVHLPLETAGSDYSAPVYLAWTKKHRRGVATQWLLNKLINHLKKSFKS
jgi:DNA-binding transcriptional LysR family regulator